MFDVIRRAVISSLTLLLATTAAAQSFVDLAVEPAGPLELRANPITPITRCPRSSSDSRRCTRVKRPALAPREPWSSG